MRAEPLSPGESLLLADAPFGVQAAALERALRCNPAVVTILSRAPALGLPSWYLGAGAVAQTVWNQLHGFAADGGIRDYDLVYFDPEGLSPEAERSVEARAVELFADLGVAVDVTNEAAVHQWFPERFGTEIEPYRSAEHAISTWPATASCIGVRREGGGLVVCAPFGLWDLYALVVRPNKAIVSESVYLEKAGRWGRRWPRLRVMPW